MVRTMREVVVRAVLMRADRHPSLRGAYSYAAAVVVPPIITNTTRAGAKPKRNKNTSTSMSILALRQMAVVLVARMGVGVGVRAGSRRLRFWIARRASKMQAFIFADVYLGHLARRAQMNNLNSLLWCSKIRDVAVLVTD